MPPVSDLEERVRAFQERFTIIGSPEIKPVLLRTGDVEIYPASDQSSILQLKLKSDPDVKVWVPATYPVVLRIENTNYTVYRSKPQQPPFYARKT